MSYYLQRTKNDDFAYLIYAFTIVEYTLFCCFIFLILTTKNPIRNILPFIWGAFIVFALFDLIYINKGVGFDSFTSGIESIIVMLLCIYYLFIQIKGTNNLMIYSTFNFWMVIAFFIYFAGTFFLYILAESMRNNISFRRQYFIINISFNILKNILLCVAMTMKSNEAVNKQKSAIPELDDDFFISKKN